MRQQNLQGVPPMNDFSLFGRSRTGQFAASRSRLKPMLATVLLLAWCGRTTLAAVPKEYQQKWRNDAVNQRIERNIESYRKGDATIQLADAAGKPVPGVGVELQQTDHEFLFGCNAFVLGQLKTAEENQRYEETFLRLFNFATVPFYWEGTEPTQGELRYQEGNDPSRRQCRRLG
jgi:hypothetical protein